tara:strand:+ start:2680 stop:6387 length:3708 start_codon:yes stop_codon:yes gene_type:complete
MAYNFKGAFEYYSGKTDKSESNPKTDLEKKNFLAHFIKEKNRGNLIAIDEEISKNPRENARALNTFIIEVFPEEHFNTSIDGARFDELVKPPKDSMVNDILPQGLKSAWQNYTSLPHKINLVAIYYIWKIEKKHDSIQSSYEEFLIVEKIPYVIGFGGGYTVSYDNSNSSIKYTNKASIPVEDYNFRRIFNETFFTEDMLFDGGTVLSKLEKAWSGGGKPVWGVLKKDILINIYQTLPKIPEDEFAKRNTIDNPDQSYKEYQLGKIKEQIEEQQKSISQLTDEEVEEFFSSKSSETLQWSIEQCILLTSLKKFADKRKKDRKISLGSGSVDYGGRVIPVHCDPPQAFVNFLNCPLYSTYYTKQITTELQQDIEYDFTIAKVKENKNNELKEYPFNFGKSDDELKSAGAAIKSLLMEPDSSNPDGPNEAVVQKQISESITISEENLNTSISFKKVSIDFKGENFATAKTNVDVTLEIEVASLLLLQIQFEDKLPGGESYTYSLVELFTYLNRSNVKNGTGASRIFKSSYNPDYNRLIMKIIPKIVEGRIMTDGKIKQFIETSQLILDLALVDYTIKKDEILQKATITINYKGFIRSFLNEPLADCITPLEIIDSRIKEEEKLIEELENPENGYCDFKSANKRISEYFKQFADLDDANKKKSRQIFIKKLLDKKQIYFFKYNAMSILQNNVDKDSKKLINPSMVAQLIKQNENVFSIANTSDDIDDDGQINLDSFERLFYFYLGDLIDVLMDFMYGQYEYSKDPRKLESPQRFKNFPMKVILPTFYPNILSTNENGEAIFVTASNDNDLVNLADIPVAVEWFKKWFQEEVVSKDLRHYPIGMFLNKLVNSLVNNVLNDDCYLMGNFERKYFSVKSDFGLFKLGSNDLFKLTNSTFFDRRFENTGEQHSWAKFGKKDIPIIEKDPKTDRLDNCNYLIVYEQMNAFTDYSDFDASSDLETILEEHEIPTFRLRRLNNLDQPTSFVKSIGFSKSDIPYQREARFQAENLNSLSQLASVHNAKITTLPYLNIYPGMLCWVDVGLKDAPNKYNSVAWLLGMGGYHIIKQVTHSANISGNRIVGSSFQTVIDAVYVNNGAGKGEQNTLCVKAKEAGNKDAPINSDGEEVVEEYGETLLEEENSLDFPPTSNQEEASEIPEFEFINKEFEPPFVRFRRDESKYVITTDGLNFKIPSKESARLERFVVISPDGETQSIFILADQERYDEAIAGEPIVLQEKISNE